MVVFEDLFLESKGKPVEYNGETVQMMDELSVGKSACLQIRFEQANSEWRQGISLTTEGTFEVGGQKIKRGLALWQDTAPQEVEVVVTSKSEKVQIKNIWDVGDGVVHSWHNGAAMIVDSDGEQKRYRCNDGHADDDFDDLVFTLTSIAF
jgi:hypothetical protein